MDEYCFQCQKKLGWVMKFDLKEINKKKKNPPKGMSDLDKICDKCINNLSKIPKTNGVFRSSSSSPSMIIGGNSASTFTSAESSPMGGKPPTTTNHVESSPPKTIQTQRLSSTTSSEQLRQLTKTLHDQYKAQWDKNGVVQIKTQSLAILQRMWGQQVQFIVACDQLSKEGYRLMAIDEGKEGNSGGFSGGINAYFYFQKIDYVR